MSVLIDVREVPWRILELVKARILANRARKDQRAKKEEVRGLTRPRPQRKATGATMSNYRRPEPVGLPPDDDTLQLGQFWFRPPRSGNWNIVVWSGDGQQQATADVDAAEVPPNYGWTGSIADISDTIPFQERFGVLATPGYIIADRGVTGSGTTYHFPLNGSTAVLIYTWEYAIWWKAGATGNLDETYDTTTAVGMLPLGRRYAFGDVFFIRGVRAFLVSKTTARQISVPASWTSRPTSYINGTQGIETMAIGSPLGIFPPGILTPHPGFVNNPAGNDLRFFDYGLGAMANYLAAYAPIDGDNYPHPQGGVWTPFASASFNQRAEISALPAGLTFAQQRARVPWNGVRETSFFLNQDEDARTVSSKALQLRDADFDAAWPLGWNTIPLDDPRWIRRRVIKTDFSSQPDPRAEEKLFWDWGKPAYCRQQLLEMGFTEADLTP